MAEGWARNLHCDLLESYSADASSEEEALEHYRRVRDEIRTFIENLPRKLAVSQWLDDGSKLQSEEAGEQR
jgi:hypothetical protein